MPELSKDEPERDEILPLPKRTSRRGLTSNTRLPCLR